MAISHATVDSDWTHGVYGVRSPSINWSAPTRFWLVAAAGRRFPHRLLDDAVTINLDSIGPRELMGADRWPSTEEVRGMLAA